MDCLKKVLSREFKIKDIGTLRYFLGMEVARFEKSVVVSQRKYILVLLKENGILGCKLANTLMESNYKIGLKEYNPSIDTGRYHRLIGKFIYLSHTWPDIGFLVGVCKSIHEQAR